MRQTPQARIRQDNGFTLIELMVVVVVIGVLASIAIPSFLGQRSKGQDACAKTIAQAMNKAARAYHVEQGSSYLGMSVGRLNRIESSIVTNGSCGSGTTVRVGRAAAAGACNTTAPTATLYCVHAVSVTGNTFSMQMAATGLVTRTCTRINTSGGCRGATATGTW